MAFEISWLSVLGWIVALALVSIIAYRAYKNYGLIAMILLLPFAASVDILLPPYGPDLETPLALAILPGVERGMMGVEPASFMMLSIVGVILLLFGLVLTVYAVFALGGAGWIYGLVILLVGALMLSLKALVSYPLVVAYAVVYGGAAVVAFLYIRFFGVSPKSFQ